MRELILVSAFSPIILPTLAVLIAAYRGPGFARDFCLVTFAPVAIILTAFYSLKLIFNLLAAILLALT